VAAQILNTIAFSIIAGVGMAYFQDLLPGKAGQATILYTNTFRVGSVLGGIMFGILISPLGFRGIFALCAVFAISALFLIILGLKNARTSEKTSN
jgi:MFS transporter, SET family, sugar efflux transporter